MLCLRPFVEEELGGVYRPGPQTQGRGAPCIFANRKPQEGAVGIGGSWRLLWGNQCPAGQPAMRGKESPTMCSVPWDHGEMSPTPTFRTDPQTGDVLTAGARRQAQAQGRAGDQGAMWAGLVGGRGGQLSTGDGTAAGGKGQAGGGHPESGDDLSVSTTTHPTSACAAGAQETATSPRKSLVRARPASRTQVAAAPRA